MSPFGQGTYKWIQNHYTLTKQTGDRPVVGQEFGVQLWNRFDNREN